MTAWPAEELDRIGAAHELEIAPLRADGTLRRSLPIWVVRAGDELYVRSWRGATGRWFLALALLVTLITHPGNRLGALGGRSVEPRLAATQNLGHPGAEALSETRAAA